MDLKQYLKKLAKRGPQHLSDFAERCGTSLGMLRQVANGHRRAGEALAINIDRESCGIVPCESLRPDVDFAYLRSTVPHSPVHPSSADQGEA